MQTMLLCNDWTNLIRIACLLDKMSVTGGYPEPKVFRNCRIDHPETFRNLIVILAVAKAFLHIITLLFSSSRPKMSPSDTFQLI